MVQETVDLQDVLDLKEAARFLKVSPVTLGRRVRAGEVPAKKIGNQWRFSRQALSQWIQSGTDRSENQ